MVEKMEEPIPHVQGRVNGRIEIAAARLYSHMIRRDRLPGPLRERDKGRESSLGSGIDAE